MSVNAHKEEEGEFSPGGRAPPYVSFQTFLSLIADLKTHGLPPRIDRSVLKRFSGGVGTQLLAAVRALGLVNLKDEPTSSLKLLVDTFETDDFKSNLRGVIDGAYPFLASLDLTTATPSMFAEAFKNATNAKDEVLRKCRTFYLYAARYAGIPLGSRIEPSGSKRGRPVGSKRRQKAKASAAVPEQSSTQHHPAHTKSNAFEDKLLEKFPAFDPAWPDNIKQQWFEGFQQFQEMARKDRS